MVYEQQRVITNYAKSMPYRTKGDARLTFCCFCNLRSRLLLAQLLPRIVIPGIPVTDNKQASPLLCAMRGASV